jgi:hypothetical protein
MTAIAITSIKDKTAAAVEVSVCSAPDVDGRLQTRRLASCTPSNSIAEPLSALEQGFVAYKLGICSTVFGGDIQAFPRVASQGG